MYPQYQHSAYNNEKLRFMYSRTLVKNRSHASCYNSKRQGDQRSINKVPRVKEKEVSNARVFEEQQKELDKTSIFMD